LKISFLKHHYEKCYPLISSKGNVIVEDFTNMNLL